MPRTKKPKQMARVVEFSKTGEWPHNEISYEEIGLFKNVHDAMIATHAILAFKYDNILSELDFENLPDHVKNYVDQSTMSIASDHRQPGVGMQIIANYLAGPQVHRPTFYTHMIRDVEDE